MKTTRAVLVFSACLAVTAVAQPGRAAGPARSGQGMELAQAGQVVQPTQPGRMPQPAQPGQAVQPGQAIQPAQPGQAGQPGQVVQPTPGAVGGNAPLMDEWAARRRQVRDKVLTRLQEQGKVPRDGTIEFEARFRPDPKDPAKLFVAVDAVRVTPHGPGKAPGRPEHVDGKAGTEAIDLALAPIEMPGRVELRTLDVPVAVSFKEAVTIREGRVDEAPAFAPAPSSGLTGGGADVGGDGAVAGFFGQVKGFWRKIVGFFGF